MDIILDKVVKRFDKTTIVNSANLHIRSGEMFFLLGPSGCGKTTILRMLAGFYDPEEGDIRFGERRMIGVPPHERNTALVFQNYAVWPHMTVFENIAYGLRVRKVPEPELTRRVNEAMDLVKMTHLATRKPSQLSGGQQQRVALARAVVVNPDLLLFDEPLCNLDAKLRIEMRDEIQRLHRKTRVSSLYVTHDQEEALSLASRIGVMNAGVIQQVGSPQEIYDQPANSFVANFIGEMNLYPADSALGQLLQASKKIVGFRPENVLVSTTGAGLSAKVTLCTYLGAKNQMVLTTEQGQEVKAWAAGHFSEGDTVKFGVDAERVRHFDA